MPGTSLALPLLWKATRLLASPFGVYEAHVAWSLIRLSFGINNQALRDGFFCSPRFRACTARYPQVHVWHRDGRPGTTARRSRAHAPPTASAEHFDMLDPQNESPGATLHLRSGRIHSITLHCIGMEFGLCCLYLAWFTILPLFGVYGWPVY